MHTPIRMTPFVSPIVTTGKTRMSRVGKYRMKAAFQAHSGYRVVSSVARRFPILERHLVFDVSVGPELAEDFHILCGQRFQATEIPCRHGLWLDQTGTDAKTAGTGLEE